MNDTIGKLLCKIGWHRWKWVGHSLFYEPAYMCVRPYCRTCKQELFAGTILWEREEQLEGDK